MHNQKYILALSSKFAITRLHFLKKIKNTLVKTDSLITTDKNTFINSSLKCVYSGHPYTPSLAFYNAYKNGVSVLGLIDTCSVKGGKELYTASHILDRLYYNGFETYNKLIFGNKNYMVKSVAYGVPNVFIDDVDAELAKYRQLKLKFSQNLATAINNRFNKFGINISYDLNDVKKQAFNKDCTYSYFLFFVTLAKKIIDKYPNGVDTVDFLTEKLRLRLDNDTIALLSDNSNPFYKEDLAKVLKNNLKFNNLVEEVLDINNFIDLCKSFTTISTIDYNKNEMSVQTAIDIIKYKNINGVTIELNDYTSQEIVELYEEFNKNDVFVIVRNDINHPRKKFDYEYIDQHFERIVKNSTLAIVGHSISASINSADGMFSKRVIERLPALSDRIKLFAKIGQKGNSLNEL